MTQRPLLGWLWPDRPARPPGSPERIATRGPARVALLVPTTIAVAALSGSALMATAGMPLGVLAVVSVAVSGALWLLARAWSAGTYVSGSGCTVRTTWAPTRRAAWADVASIGERRGRCVLELHDGRVLTTHVSSHGLDFVGRPEARRIAADRLRGWHAQSAAGR